MVKGGFQVAVPLEPVGGATVELGDELGVVQLELAPEQLAEEVVTAVPAAVAFEWDDERARPSSSSSASAESFVFSTASQSRPHIRSSTDVRRRKDNRSGGSCDRHSERK